MKDSWKVAKDMGIEYAEACTGFTFRKGKAAPDIDGIIIKKEDETEFIKRYKDTLQAHYKLYYIEKMKISTNFWKKILNATNMYYKFRLKDNEFKKTNTTNEKNNLICVEPINETEIDQFEQF